MGFPGFGDKLEVSLKVVETSNWQDLEGSGDRMLGP